MLAYIVIRKFLVPYPNVVALQFTVSFFYNLAIQSYVVLG